MAQKGGGTKKVCLPAAKAKSLSKKEKDRIIRAKEKAGRAGNIKDLVRQMLKALVKKELLYVIGLKKKTG